MKGAARDNGHRIIDLERAGIARQPEAVRLVRLARADVDRVRAVVLD